MFIHRFIPQRIFFIVILCVILCTKLCLCLEDEASAAMAEPKELEESSLLQQSATTSSSLSSEALILTDTFDNVLTFTVVTRVLMSSTTGGNRLNYQTSIEDLRTAVIRALSLTANGVNVSPDTVKASFAMQSLISSTGVPPASIQYVVDVSMIVTAPQSSLIYADFASFAAFYSKYNTSKSSCELSGCWVECQSYYLAARSLRDPASQAFTRIIYVNAVNLIDQKIVNLSPSPTLEPSSAPTLNPTVDPTARPTAAPVVIDVSTDSGSSSGGTGSLSTTIIIIIAAVGGTTPIILILAYICIVRLQKKRVTRSSRGNLGYNPSFSRPAVARDMNIVDLDAAPVVVSAEAVVVISEDVEAVGVRPIGLLSGFQAPPVPIAPSTASGRTSSPASTPRSTAAVTTPRQASLRQSSVRIPAQEDGWETIPPELLEAPATASPTSAMEQPTDPLAAMLSMFPTEISFKTFGLEWVDPSNSQIASSQPRSENL
jgi:hypothetical protein